ncbi:MAG: hypothetical protein AMXMBFR34_28170 [Myxococcaceae bacterium]
MPRDMSTSTSTTTASTPTSAPDLTRASTMHLLVPRRARLRAFAEGEQQGEDQRRNQAVESE